MANLRATATAAIGALGVVSADAAAFDLQGHRGARGLAPESTLAAFRTALDLGVTTLETDLAITKEGAVVLSHEPTLNPDIVRDGSGRWIEPPGAPLQSFTLAELKRFDIGRLNPARPYARQFPEQVPRDGERFPTLAELYALGGTRVRYNIETKTDPTRPELARDPAAFTRIVVEEIRRAGMQRQTTIQSFDWRTLVEARRIAPEIETVCLTIESREMNTLAGKPSPWLAGLDVKPGGSLAQLVKAAGCRAWSPFWRNLTAVDLAAAHRLDLTVIPWTVNDPREMARLIDLKADGLITDYPDRAIALLRAKGH